MPVIDRSVIKHSAYSYLHHRRVVVTDNGYINDFQSLTYQAYKYSNSINFVPIIDIASPFTCFVFRFSGAANCNNSQEIGQTTNKAVGQAQLVAVSGFYADESILNFSFSHLWREKDTGFLLQLRESVTNMLQDFLVGDMQISDTTMNILSSIIGGVGGPSIKSFISQALALRQILANSKIVFPEKELKVYDGFKLTSSSSYTVEKIYVTKQAGDNIYDEIIKDLSDLDLWPKVFYISPQQGQDSDLSAIPILKLYDAKNNPGADNTAKELYNTFIQRYAIGFVLLAIYFFSYFDDPNITDVNFPCDVKSYDVYTGIFDIIPTSVDLRKGYLWIKHKNALIKQCYTLLEEESSSSAIRGSCFCGCVGLSSLISLESGINGQDNIVEFVTGTGLINQGVESNLAVREIGERASQDMVENQQKRKANTVHLLRKATGNIKEIRYFYKNDDNGSEFDNPTGVDYENGTVCLNRIARYIFFPESVVNDSNKQKLKEIYAEVLRYVNTQYKSYLDLMNNKVDYNTYVNGIKNFFNNSGLSWLYGLTIYSYADAVNRIGPILRSLVYSLNGGSMVKINSCTEISTISNDVLAFFKALILMPPSNYNFVPYYTEYVKALYEGWPFMKLNGILYTIGYYGIVLLNVKRGVALPSQNASAIDKSIYYLLPEEVDVQFSNSFVYDFSNSPEQLRAPSGRPLWAKLKITFRPINDFIHIYGNFLGLEKLLILLGAYEASQPSNSNSATGSQTITNSGTASSMIGQANNSSAFSYPIDCTQS